MSWLPKSPKARRRLWVVAAVAPMGRGEARDHAAQGQLVVVGPFEEILLGVQVRRDQRPLVAQGRAEIGAVEAGHHHYPVRHARVLGPDHLDRQIGDDVAQGHGGMIAEPARAETPDLLTAIGDEQDAATVRFTGGQGPGQFQHGGGARGVVIGPVHDGAVGPDAQVIQMGTDQDDPGVGVRAGQPADGIGGHGLLDLRWTRLPDRAGAGHGRHPVVDSGGDHYQGAGGARRGAGQGKARPTG